MKTRKVLQAVTAAALIAAMAVPTSAFAEVTITAGDPAKVSGDDVSTAQSGETPITMNVTPEYTVTIPAAFNLVDNDNEAATGTPGDGVYSDGGILKVENLHLATGEKLVIKTGGSYTLTAGNATIDYIPSTEKDGAEIAVGGEICSFESQKGTDASDSQEIFVRTAEAVTASGNYSGNLTFTFSIE